MKESEENAGRTGKTRTMTFGALRKYLCCIDRLSVCMLETTEYKNFICLKHVPDDYDDLYVYGIGIIESEFYKAGEYTFASSGNKEELVFLSCLEIVLSQEPRKD